MVRVIVWAAMVGVVSGMWTESSGGNGGVVPKKEGYLNHLAPRQQIRRKIFFLVYSLTNLIT